MSRPDDWGRDLSDAGEAKAAFLASLDWLNRILPKVAYQERLVSAKRDYLARLNNDLGRLIFAHQLLQAPDFLWAVLEHVGIDRTSGEEAISGHYTAGQDTALEMVTNHPVEVTAQAPLWVMLDRWGSWDRLAGELTAAVAGGEIHIITGDQEEARRQLSGGEEPGRTDLGALARRHSCLARLLAKSYRDEAAALDDPSVASPEDPDAKPDLLGAPGEPSLFPEAAIRRRAEDPLAAGERALTRLTEDEEPKDSDAAPLQDLMAFSVTETTAAVDSEAALGKVIAVGQLIGKMVYQGYDLGVQEAEAWNDARGDVLGRMAQAMEASVQLTQAHAGLVDQINGTFSSLNLLGKAGARMGEGASVYDGYCEEEVLAQKIRPVWSPEDPSYELTERIDEIDDEGTFQLSHLPLEGTLVRGETVLLDPDGRVKRTPLPVTEMKIDRASRRFVLSASARSAESSYLLVSYQTRSIYAEYRSLTDSQLEDSRFLLYVRRFLTTYLVSTQAAESLKHAHFLLNSESGSGKAGEGQSSRETSSWTERALTELTVGTVTAFAEAWLADQPSDLWSLQALPGKLDPADTAEVARWLLPSYREALGAQAPISAIVRLQGLLMRVAYDDGSATQGSLRESAAQAVEGLLERRGGRTLNSATMKRIADLVRL